MNLGPVSKPQETTIEAQPNPEAQLKALIRAAKNDQKDFYPLYLKFVDRIYNFILARGISHQDAEDLCSEVFVRAIKNLHRFNENNSFAAWLFKIARNLTVDHYRKHKNSWLDLSEFEIPAAESPIEPETRMVLTKQLKQLDAMELDMLRLRYAARLTFVEIGQILGKSPGAIRKAHNKVIDRLRLYME